MAILLKREHGLPTLLLSNERDYASSSRGNTVFTLQVGDETIDRQVAPTAAMNLPADLHALQAYEYQDPDYTLPPELIVHIKTRLGDMLQPNAPLWLLFDAPSGFLPLVPWERLLQPELGVPLLRVPNFLVNPFSDASLLSVVLVASSPFTEPAIPHDEILVSILRPLLDQVQRRVRVDVFVDQHAFRQVWSRMDGEGLADRVRVHDPRGSVAYPNQNVASGAIWLDWINRALEGRAVDLVYFVAHGSLSASDGLLLLAESPTRNADREIFIGPQQIDALLTTAGAWSVGFSAPPQNYSGSGLRLLVEQIAQRRPGPVFLHDFAVDPGCSGLGAAYQFLFNASGLAPATPALSLYCHPDYVQPDMRRSYSLQSDRENIDRLTLAGSQAASLLQSNDAAPGWLTKSQRVLEKAAAELDRTSVFENEPSATREGYENALRYVSDVLARHAVAAPFTPAPGADQEHAP